MKLLKYVLFSAVAMSAAVTFPAQAEEAPEAESFSYVPNIHGAMRARWEEIGRASCRERV